MTDHEKIAKAIELLTASYAQRLNDRNGIGFSASEGRKRERIKIALDRMDTNKLLLQKAQEIAGDCIDYQKLANSYEASAKSAPAFTANMKVKTLRDAIGLAQIIIDRGF